MTMDLLSQIRKEKICARNSLTAEFRTAMSQMICEKIVASEAFQDAETVMLYRSVKGEVQLHFLEEFARKQQKKLVYPLCVSESEIVALEPKNHTPWNKGRFGIEEPIPEHSIVVMPEQIDLVICPCTVFDSSCNRMGMGAGYYDRYLPKCKKAIVVAVAFEIQKADRINSQPWDYRMDMIITEKNIYKN